MFCVDATDLKNDPDLQKDSMVFESFGNSNNKWIRSKGRAKWHALLPQRRQRFGLPHYDYYFKHYYNDTQNYLNMVEQIAFATTLLKQRDINHIFIADRGTLFNPLSEGKVMVNILKTANWLTFGKHKGLIDYISLNPELTVSKEDMHLSVNGHKHIAELLHNKIKEIL
jgi:hypothetical protein